MDHPIKPTNTPDSKDIAANHDLRLRIIKQYLQNNAKTIPILVKKLALNHLDPKDLSLDIESAKVLLPDNNPDILSAQTDNLNANLQPGKADGDPDLLIKQHYNYLIDEYKQQRSNNGNEASHEDLQFIDKAFILANKLHSGMTRKSGEPYIIHPIRVAHIAVKEIGLDTISVACALMHDTIEDTGITYEEIEKELGETVAKIVEGLTKIRAVFKGKNHSIASEKAENIRKILLTLGEDIRVILIKLADRLDNMRTMDAMLPHKQESIAAETQFLYAPIAHRLGLYSIKSELEDLCLKYTQPNTYQEIREYLKQSNRVREEYIRDFIKPIKQLLTQNGIMPDTYRIFGRPKHIFSIWNKIQKKGIAFEDIHDLFAIRIVLQTPPTQAEERALCYKVFAVITDHQNGGYPYNRERVRDWINIPKTNGYESLHTTVLARDGKPVEIQIRTERMDKIAERGIAAHWLYKNNQAAPTGFDKWLNDVREQLNEHRNSNAIDVLKDITLDLYEHEILVFTPKGKVLTLKENATIVDFAFAIHTDIGCTCMGGEINGKLYPISHKLKNGDQVKIISSKKVKPTQEWLNFAVTSKARNKIKSHINNDRYAAKRELSETGRDMLERKLRQMKIKSGIEVINQITRHFAYADSLDFLYSIATKEFALTRLKEIATAGDHFDFSKNVSKVVSLNDEAPQKHYDTDTFDAEDTISIFSGFADKIDYSIAKCCQPKAGDNVYGFITIGQGIRIHRADCPNAADQKKRFPYRVIALKWAKQTEDLMYLIKIKIIGFDDVGILNKISNVISSELKMNMRSLSFDSNDGLFEGYIEVYVKNEKEVKALIKRIKIIDGVHSVNKT